MLDLDGSPMRSQRPEAMALRASPPAARMGPAAVRANGGLWSLVRRLLASQAD